MTYIIDENLTPLWSEYLATSGIIARHWTKIGQVGDSDTTIFHYAMDNRMAIISQDLDFSKLLARYGTGLPSVIQLRVDTPTPLVIGKATLAVITRFASEIEKGCLISLDLESARIRLLPLHPPSFDPQITEVRDQTSEIRLPRPPDHRDQTSDIRDQMSETRPPSSDLRPLTSDLRPLTSDL